MPRVGFASVSRSSTTAYFVPPLLRLLRPLSKFRSSLPAPHSWGLAASFSSGPALLPAHPLLRASFLTPCFRYRRCVLAAAYAPLFFPCLFTLFQHLFASVGFRFSFSTWVAHCFNPLPLFRFSRTTPPAVMCLHWLGRFQSLAAHTEVALRVVALLPALDPLVSVLTPPGLWMPLPAWRSSPIVLLLVLLRASPWVWRFQRSSPPAQLGFAAVPLVVALVFSLYFSRRLLIRGRTHLGPPRVGISSSVDFLGIHTHAPRAIGFFISSRHMRAIRGRPSTLWFIRRRKPHLAIYSECSIGVCPVIAWVMKGESYARLHTHDAPSFSGSTFCASHAFLPNRRSLTRWLCSAIPFYLAT